MAQERERESNGEASEMVADEDTPASDAPVANGGGDDDGGETAGNDVGDDTGDGDGGDRPAVVARDAVGSAFVDAAPRTLPEVAEETGLERETAERTLGELVDAGALATKTLRTSASPLRTWYLPATAHVERLASGSPDDDRADAVEDAIDALDVPGVSEMMQSWRRDAIRAAWEYLVEHGAATDAAIVDAVYSGHGAGYDDRESWWECVRPRLATLPGVTRPADGTDDVWTYAPA